MIIKQKAYHKKKGMFLMPSITIELFQIEIFYNRSMDIYLLPTVSLLGWHHLPALTHTLHWNQ